MPNRIDRLHAIALGSAEFAPSAGATVPDLDDEPQRSVHPFDERNIIPSLPSKVRRLFDDGHYAEATFAAMKFLETSVQHRSGLKVSGQKLMMAAFGGTPPPIALNALSSQSEVDEQEGFRFLFTGAVVGIRNPRGHDAVTDSPQDCLDHLALVSLLMRKLGSA